MSDIKELIQLVRYDENLQQQEYPIDLCDAASAELAALEAIADAAQDVNEWLIRSGLRHTAHQMNLAEKLAALKGAE